MSDPSSMGHQFGMPGQPQFVPAFAGSAAPQAAATSATFLLGQRQPLPKQLTAAIKGCTSLERLAQLFAAHQAVLNPIHIAAMITKLPKLDTSLHGAGVPTAADLPWILSTASAQQAQLRQLLQHLLLRLKVQGCEEYSPRGVANIVWALAKLQCAPDSELQQMLLEKFCSQLPSAVPQDVSNILWGVAKLTKERSAVNTTVTNASVLGSTAAILQPMGLAGSMSSPCSSSSPSLASSSLSQQTWSLMGPGSLGSGAYDAASATALLAPLLAQDQVRLLLQHLCQQLHIASVQTISNSLWAVVVLQQEHQWCMCNCLQEVQMLLSAFCRQPHQALPGHIQPVIRCMAQLATTCSNHAGSTWIHWQPKLLKQLVKHLCNQREQMEMHHVSSVLRDVTQVVCLHLLLNKQLRDQKQQQGVGACSGVTNQGGARSSGANAPDLVSGLPSPPSSFYMLSAAEEAEEVLARLAASGGPQDASSTVVALVMLQPQLEQLELQQGVAGLCSMLPPSALPHLAEEDGQRLLAAASCLQPEAGSIATSSVTAVTALAASKLQGLLAADQHATGHMPPAPLGLPLAAADSSSTDNSSGENAVAGPSEAASAPAAGAAASLPPGVGVSSAAGHVAQTQQQHSMPVQGVSSESLGCTYGAPGDLHAQLHRSGSGRADGSSCIQRQTVGGCPSGDGSSHAQQQPLQQQDPAGLAGSSSTSNPADLPGVNLQHPPQQMQLRYALGEAAGSPAVSTTGTQSLGVGAGGSISDDVASASVDTKEEAAARQLTHNIANADSVYQLAEIFNAHSVVMDMIHITACITRLSKVLGSAPTAASQAAAASLLPMLGAKLLQVLPNANARGIANVVWGYGRLRNLPQSELLPQLLKAFVRQLATAACRDSAVVLWSLARLVEGQGLAAVGVTPDLLVRLGRAVLEQLAAAATAATDGTAGQAQQQQQGNATAGSGVTSLSESTAMQAGAASAAPSSRDISNSLMALTRLDFMPETPEDEAAATAADAQAAAIAAASDAPASETLPDPTEAAEQAAAAAVSLQSLLLQDTTIAAAPDVLAPGTDVTPRAAAGSSGQQPAEGKQAAAASQHTQQVKLTLPVKPIQIIVKFLLHHATTAKTLDLQEAATALKQLGLMELHSQVTAAISSSQFSSHVEHGSVQHGSSGSHGSGSSSMQYIHHMATAVGVGGGGSPLMSAGLPGHGSRGATRQMYGSSSSGRGGTSFAPMPRAVLARPQGQQQHAPRQQQHLAAVNVPANLNLSGTKLAGLLQQQRHQQPLQIPGPAYGAGWLPGKGGAQQQQQQQQLGGTGSGTACMLTTGGGAASTLSQQQQFVPSGGVSYMSGGDTAVRQLPGQRATGYGITGVTESQPSVEMFQAGGYLSGGDMQAQHGRYGQQRGMQQQQQQRRRPVPQHQQSQQSMPSRRLSGLQQGDVLPQQLQQHGYMTAAGQQGGVQYVYVPQQPQQQQGGYYMQPQSQQPDLLLMQQMLQQQELPGQQQQQPGQQMLMVPASMAGAGGAVNLGLPAASVAGQQQGLSGAGMMLTSPGVAFSEPWTGQQQQQQQHSQQLMQLVPQLQGAAATGNSGQLAAQLVAPGQGTVPDMQLQVSGGMLVPADFAHADVGRPQQQQLQLQVFNFAQGGSQYQQQQSPVLDAPGLFLAPAPPPPQQLESMRAAQTPAAMYTLQPQGMARPVQPQPGQFTFDPTTGYAFNPGQM